MRIRFALSVMLLVLLQVACVHAEPRTVRLLTVGNSFADNALTYLPKIVEADGNTLIYQRANLGGCSLERHWKHASQYIADPNDPKGKPYQKNKFSLGELLKADQWDVVTIQQYSFISHDLATYEPYAKNLYDYIKQNAPQAKVLIQQIWAYRSDDSRFKPENEGKQPHTHQVMYEQLRTACHTFAKELGINILPSGDAMYMADTDPKWGFKKDTTFDIATAIQPALPDQTHSLHSGWAWRKQKDGSFKLGMDGHHAGKAGNYLIGCVWYEVLFDSSVVNNSYVPEGLDADYAAFLRETAHKTVANLKAQKTAGH